MCLLLSWGSLPRLQMEFDKRPLCASHRIAGESWLHRRDDGTRGSGRVGIYLHWALFSVLSSFFCTQYLQNGNGNYYSHLRKTMQFSHWSLLHACKPRKVLTSQEQCLALGIWTFCSPLWLHILSFPSVRVLPLSRHSSVKSVSNLSVTAITGNNEVMPGRWPAQCFSMADFSKCHHFALFNESSDPNDLSS